MDKINIREIDLGKSTAEKEVKNLPNYYISTPQYLDAKDSRRRKLIYVGHRGSGKSALFQKLISEYSAKNKNVIIQITTTDYSYEAFQRMNHDFVDIKSAYGVAWYYTLLMECFTEIINYFEKNPNLKRNRENVKIIKDFLENDNITDKTDSLYVFVSYLTKIFRAKKRLNLQSENLGNSKSEAERFSNILNISELSFPLRAFDKILQTHPIYLFIDELDTGWDNTSEAKNFISGLIFASLKLNRIQDLNVFLSLRRDMYNNLSSVFRDAEKMRDDITGIKWTRLKLKAVISNRIAFNEEAQKYVSSNKLDKLKIDYIDLLFDKCVFDFILDHSLYRPREIIYMANLMLEEYREHYLTKNYFQGKLTMNCAKAVLVKFCSDRFHDFCSEYNFELPGIKFVLASFEGQQKSYSIDSFINVLNEIFLDYLDNFIESDWLDTYIDKPNRFVQKLFDIGFIHISLNGNDFFASHERQPMSFAKVKHVRICNMFSVALDCR